MWSLSLGGGGGGGGRCSPPLCGAIWASASMKESVECVLMRRGARRRRLLGVQGRLTWARSEGDTMLLLSSASANHGGICSGAAGSRSGMKAGFSTPTAHITFTLWKKWHHIWTMKELLDVPTSSSVGEHGERPAWSFISRGAVSLWELKI